MSVLPLTITTFCVAGACLVLSALVVFALGVCVCVVLSVIIMVRLPRRLGRLQESCHRGRAELRPFVLVSSSVRFRVVCLTTQGASRLRPPKPLSSNAHPACCTRTPQYGTL